MILKAKLELISMVYMKYHIGDGLIQTYMKFMCHVLIHLELIHYLWNNQQLVKIFRQLDKVEMVMCRYKQLHYLLFWLLD